MLKKDFSFLYEMEMGSVWRFQWASPMAGLWGPGGCYKPNSFSRKRKEI